VSGNRSPAAWPAPADGENKPFIEAVREARAEIAAGIDRGGLRHDPLRHPLAALSTVLGLFPGFLDEIQRVRAPWTEDERRAAVADAVARMDTRLAHRMMQFNRWAIAVALLLGMAIAGGAGAGGYWRGYRAAESQLLDIPATVGVALTGRDAAVWRDLMRDNDIARVNRTCAQQNGRNACSFVMWAEPMPPRANSGR
jgi:hypothetical protein